MDETSVMHLDSRAQYAGQLAALIARSHVCLQLFDPDAAIFPKIEFDPAIIKERLEKAGYKQKDPGFLNWSSKYFGKFYSASMLVFMEGDGQDYTKAADGQVLDLSVGQG